VRAEAFDANGKPQPAPYGGAPIGRVMFTSSGRMMAMTGDGRQEVPAGQVREYNTYAGTYTFNGKRLITRVDSCSNPAYMSTEQVREVGQEGGLMVLRPPVRTYAGRPADAEQFGLLRACGDRPRDNPAAKNCDEFAPSHWTFSGTRGGRISGLGRSAGTNAAPQWAESVEVSSGSSTVDLRRLVPRQFYPPIAVAIAATAKMPVVCQFLP
jgi:hypothetical protein